MRTRPPPPRRRPCPLAFMGRGRRDRHDGARLKREKQHSPRRIRWVWRWASLRAQGILCSQLRCGQRSGASARADAARAGRRWSREGGGRASKGRRRRIPCATPDARGVAASHGHRKTAGGARDPCPPDPDSRLQDPTRLRGMGQQRRIGGMAPRTGSRAAGGNLCCDP